MTPNEPSEMTAALARRYHRDAVAYRDYWASVLMQPASRLVDGMARTDAGYVLDNATGVGTLLPKLRAHFAEANVVGVDLTPAMVELADGDVAVMDAMALAIADDVVDALVMSFVLFHLPDIGKGLSEARRVMRPGAEIAVATWGRDIDAVAVTVWNEELEAAGAIAADALPVLARHEFVDSPDKVRRLLEDVGFEVTAATCFEFAHEMTLDDFIRLRKSVGSNRQRFESLNDAARASCVERVRERLRGKPGDVTFTGEAVFAYARCPQRANGKGHK